MSYVMAGIKELYIAAGGATFPIDYTNIFGMGHRQDGNLVISHINEMRDNRNRAFPNMLNFKIEMPTLQLDDASLIKALIDGAKAGSLAVACVTSGVTKSGTAPNEVVSVPTGGLFLFDGTSNCMGVDFEFMISLKERTLKLTLERAFKYTDGLTLINNAKTNTIKFTAGKLPELDDTKVVQGFVSPTFIPAGFGAGVYADINLEDFSIKISTKGQKNGFNVSQVQSLPVELTATANGPDVDAVKEAVTYEMTSSNVTIDIGATELIFAPKGLTRIGEVDLGDAKRTAKFTYAGDYDIDYVTKVSNQIIFNTFLQ